MRIASHLVSVALALWGCALAAGSARPQAQASPAAQPLRNPLTATPGTLTTGKTAYDTYCAGCHGPRAEGAVRAGVTISIIQEMGGKQPPDLTDAQYDHGGSDAEVFTAIKQGVPPTMMAGYDGRLSDEEIWAIVTYLRVLQQDPALVVETAAHATGADRPTLVLAEYARLPITGDVEGELTRGLLARVNYLREEPGGRRFFVNDQNGPLYILDKATRQFTTYLDFNGLAGRPGLFRRFTFERNFATGLISVTLDPDYARNGVLYTVHMEDPTTDAPAEPASGVVAGLDVAGWQTTTTIMNPDLPDARVTREAVLIEWTDRDIGNATFEGTAREILRVHQSSPAHPLAELSFNPAARPGDADWRVMYIGSGDTATGERRDFRRLNPQRLDTLVGKILRIVPDLRAHVATSTVSANGRYRVPTDNPFVGIEGARPEIWAVGLRNPHRLLWDVDPQGARPPRLFAFNIGLTAWETVVLVERGANYGYPLREGPQAMTPAGMTAVPADDRIPWHVTDTVTRGTVTPAYPVIAYPHDATGGDAISSGIIYRGERLAALRDTMLFGDITTGRLWYARMADVTAAHDGVATTLAPLHELDAGLRHIVEETFRARGARGEGLPGAAAVSGRGRVDMRIADDADGEIYVLTKSDGVIRRVVGVR